MAYDRYDTRDEPRDQRSRWPDDRNFDRDRGWRGERRPFEGRRDDRGFWDRASDEVASWFGDDDADRRRRDDQMRDESERGFGGYRREFGPSDRGRGSRPMTGDYGRFERERSFGDRERDVDRSQGSSGRDDSRHEDPHYRSWRDRHMSELDRDYDDYARENQSRFEHEFGTWRERRRQKRALLGDIREHMEVVGDDELHVGTVDKVAGDRIILAKSDPDSGGVHHSLSCSDIGRVEGDRVYLDCSAEQARNRWRDESRGRALFERDDQGEMGPRSLNRSFEGTYR